MSEKIPTIKEIAKLLKVSVSTVSRALSDHPRIGLATKERVNALAKELNYEPNTKAINFKQGKSFVLGVIVPDVVEEFFSKAISGIEDAAMEKGYTILFGQSHDSFEKEKMVVDAMKKQRVDGVLISLSKETANFNHIKELEKYDIPVVYFDRTPDSQKVNKVFCSLFNSTVELIDRLFKKGKKRIAFINGPDELSASKERLQGYIEGISKKKLKVDMRLVEKTDFSEEQTHAAMYNLMSQKKKPDAIICFNDYVHLHAVDWAIKNNITINEDIVFASYANISFNRFTAHPPEISVDQAPYKQGQIAVDVMLEILNNKNENNKFINKEIKTELVET
ncbi:MAG: LacI family transcriptional regulator [Chitinophagaceae bacterium]|nr:MAG: LacI family transcriptional regulator [Chitinophagaceae bacterium]